MTFTFTPPYSYSRFRTDRYTGAVSVADCATPGSGNCLDYEQQESYTLNFEAWDKFGEGNMASVRLVIRINDNNDNTPTFALSEYVRFIDEGKTVPVPELVVEVSDFLRNTLMFPILGTLI